jgi:GH24 family phage-related lysozyme (muramidase)
VQEIKDREGLRLKVYDDATGREIRPGSILKGHPTIGWGCNLEAGISEAAAEFLFQEKLKEAEDDLWGLFRPLPPGLTMPRWVALVDMRYQMGGKGFRGFHKMLLAVAADDWATASEQCLDSEYGRTHPVRAGKNAEALKEG